MVNTQDDKRTLTIEREDLTCETVAKAPVPVAVAVPAQAQAPAPVPVPQAPISKATKEENKGTPLHSFSAPPY